MNIHKLCYTFDVRTLNENDINEIYNLAINNPLYYKHCPPIVTKQSIQNDMTALPSGKEKEDKFYIGYFNKDELIAVMDVIRYFPNTETVFIGFYMMKQTYQGKGIGTQLIEEFAAYLKTLNYHYIRLGYMYGNPQSKAFWTKNNFKPTGETSQNETQTIILMQREL